MLTANYLTDKLEIRPEYHDELGLGDLSAPTIFPAGSMISQKSEFFPGMFLCMPSYEVRPTGYGYAYSLED